MTCDYTVVPSDDVGLGWDDAEGDENVVERSQAGGPWTAIHTANGGDEVQFLDTTVPPRPFDYRVRSYAAGSLVSTTVCQEVPYQVSIDASEVDLRRSTSGDVGGDGAGPVAPVPLPDLPVEPSPDPLSAPTLCGALSGPGGSGAGGTLRQEVNPNPSPGYTRVTLPAQTYLDFDVENFKAPFTDGGNWIGRVDLLAINGDGTAGPGVSCASWSTRYYWDDRTELDGGSVANTGPSNDEFFLKTSAPTIVGLRSTTEAYFNLMNVSIKRISDDEVIGRPCDGPAVNNCAAQGGDYYFAAPTMVDGEELLGCVEYDSCVADLSPNIDLLVTDLNGIAEWACENDELLDALLVAALSVVVIAGVVYVAPSAAAAIAGVRGSLARLAASEAGATTIKVTLGEGVVVTVVAAGLYLISQNRVDELAQSLPDIDLPTLREDPQTGEIEVEGPSLAEQVYDRAGYDEAIRPSDSPAEESVLRRLIIRGLQACLATLTIAQAQQIADRYSPGHVVTSFTDFVVDTTEGLRHLCGLATIYYPGGVTYINGRPMGQATAHMNEVLYGDDPYAAAPHTGTQPPLPQPQWIYLNRDESLRVDGWYADPPYDCKGSKAASTDCDEWPWQATAQGGPPAPGETQPHLRIIAAGDNRVSGREVLTFMGRCDIDDTDGFFVVPSPTPLMVNGWLPGGTSAPIRSAWVGPSCTY